MSSSTMREPVAIKLRNVYKIYKLHGSQTDQLIDVMGLQRFGFKTKTPAKEFAALCDLSLDVPKGHRIGIVGRNGAGKTTLLKLICGNFAPTSGEVEVNGTVQALMNIGLGFHPEYTGRENVEASLQYNGLARNDYQIAMQGIIDFCELGEFFDQPFKTYSLGMQARLMFAAATAIQPDILIVDEVLGAGDAYFVAKSKIRIQQMINSGCTMLLVSHSMQQVLELCDTAIWLDHGVIKMQGDSLVVVKAYEESLHVGSNLASLVGQVSNTASDSYKAQSIVVSEKSKSFDFAKNQITLPKDIIFQFPEFVPHQAFPKFPSYNIEDVKCFRNVERGGISRWDSEVGIKVIGFSIQTEHGFENRLRVMHPVKFILLLEAEISMHFSCMYGFVLNDMIGNVAVRIWSPPDVFEIKAGENKVVEMLLNPVQIGPGEYTIGVSVIKAAKIEFLNTTPRYDLLGRSFNCTVELDETLGPLTANFIHSAEWVF